MCDEWRTDFISFYNWAMSNGYSDNLTIDRIDNNKGYTPDNCRWTTRKGQQQNRRSCMYFTIDGVTRCLKDWCTSLGLNYGKVYMRVKRYHWPIEKALELDRR